MSQESAMWSGPRNISTALDEKLENRADCAVVDEPLYAFYLHRLISIIPGELKSFNLVPPLARPPNNSSAISSTLRFGIEVQVVHHLLPSSTGRAAARFGPLLDL